MCTIATLLFLQASPRKTASQTIRLAQAYLDALQVENPGLEVDMIELWDSDLPAFDGNKAAAKMNVIAGVGQDAVLQTAWDQVVEIANRFISADRYLIAAPMWNSGIPYRLKQYIDGDDLVVGRRRARRRTRLRPACGHTKSQRQYQEGDAPVHGERVP